MNTYMHTRKCVRKNRTKEEKKKRINKKLLPEFEACLLIV